MTQSNAVFQCQDLASQRGEKILFRQLGFSLQSGALLVVQGDNGRGKSTLLQILSGLLPPSHGSITYKDEPLRRSGLFLQELLFIGHKVAVKPEFTVKEDLTYWAKLRGDDALIDAALDYFDLTYYQDTRCGELSAGWQQRVALARLLAVPAKLWILDEPTNNLDAHATSLFNSLVMSRVEQGGIVIMASHGIVYNKEIKTLDINMFE